MKKEEIFQHFNFILNDLVDHSVFFKTFLQAPSYLDYWIYGGNYGIPANISLTSGVTRACLIDNDYDWVVKFDIKDDYYGSACEREEYIYKRAEKVSLNQYFAEALYIGNFKKTYTFYDGEWVSALVKYDGADTFSKAFFENKNKFGNLHTITVDIPLYAYPKVEDDNYCYYSATKDELNQIKKFKSPLSDKSQAVGIEFIRLYGLNEYQRLTDFLWEVDANDFHCGNVGIIDGKFVLIDYAGYFDPKYDYDDEDRERGLLD